MIRIIIAILAAYFLAQFSKFIYNYIKTGRFIWQSFLQNGGMPSSHTSTTVAMTFALLLNNDFVINEFVIISAVFTLIVMNDAYKVRMETGTEAEVLNKIIEKEDINHKLLNTKVGHKPIEVAMGFILGIIVAFLVFLF